MEQRVDELNKAKAHEDNGGGPGGSASDPEEAPVTNYEVADLPSLPNVATTGKYIFHDLFYFRPDSSAYTRMYRTLSRHAATPLRESYERQLLCRCDHTTDTWEYQHKCTMQVELSVGPHKPKLIFSLKQLPHCLNKHKILQERHKLYYMFALQAYCTLFALRSSSRNAPSSLGSSSIL